MNWHARYLQQAGWTSDLRAYLFERARLGQARRVLEVGCGTGALLGGMRIPGALHGLDIQPAALSEARNHAPSAVLVCGDALRLPYPARTFDITFCHFLLLWVGRPLEALLEMKRVTRPGGSILALAEPDYNARVDEPPALKSLGAMQTASLLRQGAAPDMGSRLAETFSQAGIRLVETGPIRSRADASQTAAGADLEWAALEADLAGFLPAGELQRYQTMHLLARQRGERVLYVPTYFAWGEV